MITQKDGNVFTVADETRTTKILTVGGMSDVPLVIWSGSLEDCVQALNESKANADKYQSIVDAINAYNLATKES